MFMSIKSAAVASASICLLFGASALAEQKAPQTWAPPAEIAPKAAPTAPGAPAVAAPAAPATPALKPDEARREKEKSCQGQADAKGLSGKARRQFRADCMKAP